MNNYIVNVNKRKSQISKHIYGHFSEHLGRCIYEGIWVGQDSNIPNKNGYRTDVLEALKKMKLPVLRWPGGCFADEYHWKDGIGPVETRKKMINTNWGGVVEDNSFGTHEFMGLCEEIGCEPYINGNLGSGTVQEMAEWVEYMTFDGVSPMAKLREQNGRKEPWAVKYFGIGNENWGCGGNMRAEYYADEYRRYQSYVKNYSNNKIYKIACGPSDHNYEWMDVLMKNATQFMDGISLHYYTVPGTWEKKGSATNFDTEEYYRTLSKTMYMDELITKHSAIMDKYDKEKRVGLLVDEWGTWFDVEPGTNPGFLFQQNTMRDALVAGLNLNIFNKHSDRVHMANIAQLVNVLQAVILTEGDKMILTPTYHVFDMFSVHQESTLVDSFIDSTMIGPDDWKINDLHESASIDADGKVHVTICNADESNSKDINGIFNGFNAKTSVAKVVTGAMNAHNTFENSNAVCVKDLAVSITDNGFKVTVPPCSVTRITFE